MVDPGIGDLSILTTDGDLITRSTDPVRLPVGSEGQVFQVVSGLPAWADLIARELGELKWFARPTLPDGWVSPDGSAISRTDFADYFALVSTTFGVGDGSTTFNVPNVIGRSLVAAGTGSRSFAISAVDTGADSVTVPSNLALVTGQAVVYTSSGSAIAGLTSGNTYYVKRLTDTTVGLCSTLANAVAGVVINLTSVGSGTQVLLKSLSARSVGDALGEETHALTAGEMPIHTHSSVASSGAGQSGIGINGVTSGNTGAAGGSAAHNNMQPSFVALLGLYVGVAP